MQCPLLLWSFLEPVSMWHSLSRLSGFGPPMDFKLFCTSCKNSGNEVLLLIHFCVCAVKREHLEKAAVEETLLRLDTSPGWQPQLVCGTNYSVELRHLNVS